VQNKRGKCRIQSAKVPGRGGQAGKAGSIARKEAQLEGAGSRGPVGSDHCPLTIEKVERSLVRGAFPVQERDGVGRMAIFAGQKVAGGFRCSPIKYNRMPFFPVSYWLSRVLPCPPWSDEVYILGKLSQFSSIAPAHSIEAKSILPR